MAAVVIWAAPLTTLDVSPLTNPLIWYVRTGLFWP